MQDPSQGFDKYFKVKHLLTQPMYMAFPSECENFFPIWQIIAAAAAYKDGSA